MQAILLGHRGNEITSELSVPITIEQGTENRKEISLPEINDLKGKTIMGAYIIRQWDKTDKLTAKTSRNPLLSVEALGNAWITLMGEGGCPVIRNKPLITLSVDILQNDYLEYPKLLKGNGYVYDSSTICIDTSKLVEAKEDLVIHFIYLDPEKCKEQKYQFCNSVYQTI